METREIPIGEFFPYISGNITDYSLTIPKEYSVYTVSPDDIDFVTSPFFNNSLVGLQNDLDDLLDQARQGDKITFRTTRGVFRARFTSGTGVDEQGKFVDRTNGPISAALYEAMGMTDVVFQEGFFHGINSVPMAMIMAKFQGSYVRMFYLYSPVDNLVVLFSLQGGTDQADNDDIWQAFVASM